MSDRIDLSPEQRGVVEAGHGPLVVVASAGAGKTRVLVERYLRHVRDGVSPDALLTITFTRKAAAEMKRRIVDALVDEGRLAEAQAAETGPIQTIHAFCQRLLRENALAAGVDPDVEILADSAQTRLQEEAIEETLAFPPDSPDAEALIAVLAGKRSPWEAATAHARLKGAVRRVLDTLRGSRVGIEVVEKNHWDAKRTLATQLGAFLRSLPESVREAYEGPDDEWDVEALATAFKAGGRRPPRWLRDPQRAEIEAAAQACGLARLACAAWRRMEARMEAVQAFDFAALEARAVRLLETSEATRRRLSAQFAYVLVDEAQDVNPVQYALLDALGVGAMLVGDPQQSIYGFRQADVELFRARTRDSRAHRLHRNYRSAPGILTFIDHVFGSIWTRDYSPMREEVPLDLDAGPDGSCDGVEVWLQMRRDTAGVAAAIQELVRSGIEPGQIAVLVRRASYGIDVVERLAGLEVPARMVGGSERFFTRLEVRDVANALRALCDPTDDFSLLAALRSPIGGLSLDAVVMLAGEPGAGERLEAFEPELEEDRQALKRFLEWFLPLRRYADRLAAWEVVAELFARTAYLERLAERPDAAQRLANVRKLLRLASDDPELGPLEFARRIRGIQALQHKEGDAPALDADEDAVTVTTIHKAKGLEFPVVVVPETHVQLAGKARDLYADPWVEIVSASFDPPHGLAHSWLAERAALREREEELRVLYVALTRAQTRLVVCAHAQAPAGTAAQLLGRLVGRTGEALPGVKVVDLDDPRPPER